MAITGGGGAGNPTGGTAGVGKGLNYVGEHVYAYSGIVTDAASGTASVSALDFRTGSGYIIAKLSILSDETGSAGLYTKIELNGENIFRLNIDATASGAHQFDNPFRLLIPAYSRFHLYVGSNDTVDFTAFIVGRVYQ